MKPQEYQELSLQKDSSRMWLLSPPALFLVISLGLSEHLLCKISHDLHTLGLHFFMIVLCTLAGNLPFHGSLSSTSGIGISLCSNSQ